MKTAQAFNARRDRVLSMEMAMNTEKCKVALVGCGRIARAHMAACRKLEDVFEVAAFVDTDLSRAEACVKEFGAGRAYGSLEEAAANEDLQAVDLCLPPAAHCPVTVEAADMGLHVITEKPLAVTCEEVDRMVEAGKRNDVVVMSGQSRRFNGPLRKMKELLDSDAIGKPLVAHMACSTDIRGLATPWWGDPDASGPSNMLANWGSHSLDELYYLYGVPARVYAEGADTGGPTAGMDVFSAVFGYESGFVANMTWSYVGALPGTPPDQIKGCLGTKGTAQYGVGVKPTGVLSNGEPVPNEDLDVNQFHTMLREFHAAITEKREPETSALRCRVVIEMIEAILKSCETHKVVPIVGTGAVTY